MPKKIVDPKSGAVIMKLTPEEQSHEKLRKRVVTLEQKVERLELLVKQLLEVNRNG